MTNRQRWGPILCLALHFGGGAVAAQEPRLVDFELKDQFGKVYRAEDYVGKVVVLIGSDKGGSSFNGSWGNAIYEAVRDEPGIERYAPLPQADLRGVPFFVKGMIKKKFPRDEEQWVLLDWKGHLAEAYTFEPESSNIVVFAGDGTLMHRAYGREVDPAILNEIVVVIRDLLATP